MPLDGLVAARSGDVGSLYPDFAALRHSEALKEVVGAPVREECPRGEPPRCAFRLPAPGA